MPTADKQKFIDHAEAFESFFKQFGATRILECWGEDVPVWATLLRLPHER